MTWQGSWELVNLIHTHTGCIRRGPITHSLTSHPVAKRDCCFSLSKRMTCVCEGV